MFTGPDVRELMGVEASSVATVTEVREWLHRPVDDERTERILAFLGKAVDEYEWSDEYARSTGELVDDEYSTAEIRALFREVKALRAEHAATVKAINDLIDVVKPHVDDLIPTIDGLMNHPMLRMLGGKR